MEARKELEETSDRNIMANIYVIALTWGLLFPLFTMETQYEQIYMVVLGATPSIVGLVYGISIITLAFARLIGGYLADEFGRKRIIYVFTYVIGFLYLIPAFIPDWRVLAISLVLINASFLFQPAVSAIMADSTSPKTRGRFYSIMNTVSLLTTIPSPLIALWIISSYGIIKGMQLVYLLLALGLIVAGFIRQVFMVETHVKNVDKDSINISSAITSYLESLSFIKEKLKWPLVARIIMFVAGFAVLNFTGIYVSEVLGFGKEYWGKVFFYANIITVAVIIGLGYLADRVDKRIPILATLFTYSPLVYVLSIIRGFPEEYVFPMFVFSVASILIVNNAVFSLLFALEADLIPKHIRGKTQALLALISSLISALTQIIFGRLFEIDPSLLFQMASILVLIAAFYLLVKRKFY